MTTDKIHVIDRYIEYNEADCEQGVEWLIKDILNEIETRLRIKLQSKPKKATVLLIYNAINEDGSMIFLEAEDKQGNKAKIEVNEFKTLQDAYKVIVELKEQVENLKHEIKKLKDGTSDR